MSKHTPGPWHCHEKVGVYAKDGKLVASIHTPISDRSHDAILIAAAPDLLEVVQKLVAWSEAERDPSGTTFWQRVEMCREVDALASAAIAKATGEPA